MFPRVPWRPDHEGSGQINAIDEEKDLGFRTVTFNLRVLSPDRQEVKSSKCLRIQPKRKKTLCC